MSIPSGTVTLLFTDIEGSTHLWEDAPIDMASALLRHDELMRHAMDAHGGYVFKTIGDAFCVAFTTGHAALRAALDAQTALASEAWPRVPRFRVRMALHTGVCQERDGDYFGPTVNRTARLMGIGHGGQLLVSGVTSELLFRLPPDEGLLRDLGQTPTARPGSSGTRLATLLTVTPFGVPVAEVLDNPELPNNLPELLSSFVGRDEELNEVRTLIRENRLVTLTGAGGSGKDSTRHAGRRGTPGRPRAKGSGWWNWRR